MKKPITIDYYQGAYGPTIRMDVHSAEGLVALRNILHALAAGGTRERRFHQLSFVELIEIYDIILTCVRTRRNKTVVAERKQEGDKMIFHWSNTLEGWSQCAELLDGISGTKPAHQYLSQEGLDDALIVVAFLE